VKAHNSAFVNSGRLNICRPVSDYVACLSAYSMKIKVKCSSSEIKVFDYTTYFQGRNTPKDIFERPISDREWWRVTLKVQADVCRTSAKNRLMVKHLWQFSPSFSPITRKNCKQKRSEEDMAVQWGVAHICKFQMSKMRFFITVISSTEVSLCLPSLRVQTVASIGNLLKLETCV